MPCSRCGYRRLQPHTVTRRTPGENARPLMTATNTQRRPQGGKQHLAAHAVERASTVEIDKVRGAVLLKQLHALGHLRTPPR